MKKFISLLLVFCMVACGAVVLADETAEVYVTISLSPTDVPVILEKIAVSDADSDGTLTINDAFICAHDALFEGGSDAGYSVSVGEYTSIVKLWGVENNGSYMYYLNNALAGGLSDPVKDGDVLHAYVINDTVAYSDAFMWFENTFDTTEPGAEYTLTLYSAGFDENWSPVVTPVEGAAIIIDDEVTQITTDAEGKAVITLDGEGEHIISAADGSRIIVAPFLKLTVLPVAEVFVTVSVSPTDVPAKLEKVSVTDVDGDLVLTIYDAFVCAHDALFEGGSEAGFATVVESWGPRIDKLWGVECGVNCFYYLNNVAAGGLSDQVKDGDVLHAFVYTDTVGFSDAFSHFEKSFDEIDAGEELALTLVVSGYDEQWNPVSLPLEGATITVDGEATGIKTDAEGKATITLDKKGSYIISALDESRILVAPIMKLTVNEAAPAPTTEAAPVSDAVNSSAPAPAASVAPVTADGTVVISAAVIIAAIISIIGFSVRRKNEI
ncbi:MAG: hypothetical protein IJV00_01940 [Clostridia bacterium]|nr:hypothetical protein [Clostridia bacterium]